MIKLNKYNVNTIVFLACSLAIIYLIFNYKLNIIDTFFTSTTTNPEITQTEIDDSDSESVTTNASTNVASTNVASTNVAASPILSTTSKKPKVYNVERFIKSFSKDNHLEPFGYYNKGYYPKEIEIKPVMTHEEFLNSDKSKKHILF
jgi:hypothetical protein